MKLAKGVRGVDRKAQWLRSFLQCKNGKIPEDFTSYAKNK